VSLESALAMFGVAFTAWAAVVGLAARRFLLKLDDIDMRITGSRQHSDENRIEIERRLTRIETMLRVKYQAYLKDSPESD